MANKRVLLNRVLQGHTGISTSPQISHFLTPTNYNRWNHDSVDVSNMRPGRWYITVQNPTYGTGYSFQVNYQQPGNAAVQVSSVDCVHAIPFKMDDSNPIIELINDSPYWLYASLSSNTNQQVIGPHASGTLLQSGSYGNVTIFISFVTLSGGLIGGYYPQYNTWSRCYGPVPSYSRAAFLSNTANRESHSISGMAISSASSKTINVNIQSVTAAAFSGTYVTGGDFAPLEFDNNNKWHRVTFDISTTGYQFEHVRFRNSTDYVIAIDSSSIYGLSYVLPHADYTYNVPTPGNRFTFDFSYILNGGGLLTV